MTIFLGFAAALVLSGVFWTRKGQGEIVAKKVLKEIDKPIYSEKLQAGFKEVLGKKASELMN